MTIREAQQKTLGQLNTLYDEREAGNITDWVMEHITGKKKIDRLLNKQALMPVMQLDLLDRILQQLSTHKPVQYVLGEAWFARMLFFVNEHVLIPRPETEELVSWIAEENQKAKETRKTLLDIGTGSGCIAIAIKKQLPEYNITSIDVSEGALQVAKKNAHALDAEINFLQVDFLNDALWENLPLFETIVSNPPYIKQSERNGMSKQVTDFEPAVALFVPDEDPLLFYRKISLFAKTNLEKEGSIFLEINESLGKEVVLLYEREGFSVELRKDLQGKDRMVRLTTLA